MKKLHEYFTPSLEMVGVDTTDAIATSYGNLYEVEWGDISISGDN